MEVLPTPHGAALFSHEQPSSPAPCCWRGSSPVPTPSILSSQPTASSPDFLLEPLPFGPGEREEALNGPIELAGLAFKARRPRRPRARRPLRSPASPSPASTFPASPDSRSRPWRCRPDHCRRPRLRHVDGPSSPSPASVLAGPDSPSPASIPVGLPTASTGVPGSVSAASSALVPGFSHAWALHQQPCMGSSPAAIHGLLANVPSLSYARSSGLLVLSRP